MVSSRGIRKIILICAFLTGCTGFHTSKNSYVNSADSSSQTGDPAVDLITKGALLYAQKCAACHGELSISVKQGRTVTQITSALGTVPNMAPLAGGLSSGDITAIAAALAPHTSQPGTAPLKFQCTNPATRGLSEAHMARLTTPQLINTLNDLLGADIVADTTIQTQLKTLPADIMAISVTEIAPSPSDIQPTTMLNITSRAGDIIAANPTLRNRTYGTCSGATPITTACAQTFIETFGAKAYRRPLATTETSTLLAQFQTAGGVDGLTQVMMRMLMSPNMLFHVELGSSIQNNRVRLSDYEVAARLAYRITGTLPDSQLMQAAASGQLKDLNNIRSQAKRLISASATAKAKVTDFFRFYSKYDQGVAPYAPAGSLNGIDTNGIQDEIGQETKEFIDNVVWAKNGKLKDLMTSTEVFPRSDRMAKILETNKAIGSTPAVTNSGHAGLLLRPLMFTTTAVTTKPYHRASVIRSGYLCEIFAPPDPNALKDRQAVVGDLSMLSNRDRLATLTNVPVCLNCHSYLNPVGFVLEGYDQLGMRRTVETNFNANGTVTGTHPIDTTVGRTYISDLSGNEVMSLANAMGLVQAIAEGPAVRSCFAQRVFEYQRARTYAPEDTCALNEVEAGAGTATVLDVFVNGVANEDIFWKAKGL